MQLVICLSSMREAARNGETKNGLSIRFIQLRFFSVVAFGDSYTFFIQLRIDMCVILFSLKLGIILRSDLACVHFFQYSKLLCSYAGTCGRVLNI